MGIEWCELGSEGLEAGWREASERTDEVERARTTDDEAVLAPPPPPSCCLFFSVNSLGTLPSRTPGCPCRLRLSCLVAGLPASCHARSLAPESSARMRSASLYKLKRAVPAYQMQLPFLKRPSVTQRLPPLPPSLPPRPPRPPPAARACACPNRNSKNTHGGTPYASASSLSESTAPPPPPWLWLWPGRKKGDDAEGSSGSPSSYRRRRRSSDRIS